MAAREGGHFFWSINLVFRKSGVSLHPRISNTLKYIDYVRYFLWLRAVRVVRDCACSWTVCCRLEDVCKMACLSDFMYHIYSFVWNTYIRKVLQVLVLCHMLACYYICIAN